ncbi:MAG: branched-chain amino acid ABC transporter permease [Candidatus Bathyarchaeota archaeon]|nr:branched-chain amino acid ABC transporter permease [Candidatus Bathyarchaeota archaeon]
MKNLMKNLVATIKNERFNVIAACLGAIGLLGAPFYYRNFSVFFYIMLYLVMTASCNIIYGYTGYVAFGYVVFYGMGAYSFALLTSKLHVPLLPALLSGGLAAVALATVTTPALRLRGPYFALANLAIAESMRIIFLNIPAEIAGGSFGIPLLELYDPLSSYYSMFAFMIMSLIVIWILLERTKFGVILKAIKEDDVLAEAVGINVSKYKIIAWLVCAFFPGILGAIDAWYTCCIDPASAFHFMKTVNTKVFLIVGGAGTFAGPILGSVTMYIANYFLMITFPLISMLLFGLVMTATILYFPEGLIGLLRRAKHWLTGKS